MPDKTANVTGRTRTWLDGVGAVAPALMPGLILVHFLCSRQADYPYWPALACLLASLLGALVWNLRRTGQLFWVTLLFLGLLHFGVSPSLGSLVLPASLAGLLLASFVGGAAAAFIVLAASLLLTAVTGVEVEIWLLAKLMLGALGALLIGSKWLQKSEKPFALASTLVLLVPYERALEIIWISAPQGALIGEGAKWTDGVMAVVERALPACVIVGALATALVSALSYDEGCAMPGGQRFRLWLTAVSLACLGQTGGVFEALAPAALCWSLGIALALPHLKKEGQNCGSLTLPASGLLKAAAALTVLCSVAFGAAYWRALLKVDEAMPMLAGKSPPSKGGLSPENLRQVVVASEDRHFYQHRGVDWEALHRALRRNIQERKFVQGGSTITQQAARYAFLGKEKTLSRKLEEFFLALAIETKLTKRQILEVFLANADFGFGQKGASAASTFYFGLPLNEVTLAESFFLAGAVWKPPKTVQQLSAPLEHRQKIVERFASMYGMVDNKLIWRHAQEPPHRLFSKGSLSDVVFAP